MSFFCKKLDSKYFRFLGPYSQSLSQLFNCIVAIGKKVQTLHKWMVILCSNKILLIKTRGGHSMPITDLQNSHYLTYEFPEREVSDWICWGNEYEAKPESRAILFWAICSLPLTTDSHSHSWPCNLPTPVIFVNNSNVCGYNLRNSEKTRRASERTFSV